MTEREVMREDALSAYLDGELDDVERAEVEARLATSPEWRAILEELRETRDALRALPAVDPPPDLWSRILGDDQVVDLAAKRRERRERRPVWKLVAAAAAAVIVIVVGIAAVPRPDKVEPAVATFTKAHATRSSLSNDAVSSLAAVGIPEPTR